MMVWIIIIVASILALGLIVAGISAQAKQQQGRDHFVLDPTTDTTSGGSEPLDSTLSRPTSFTHPSSVAGGGFLIVFGLLWTGPTLILLSIISGDYISNQYTYNQLKERGITVEAVVIDHRAYTDAERDNHYFITYQYTAPLLQGDTQSFTRETWVSRSSYEAMHPGTHISIIYSTTDPSLSRRQNELKAPSLLGYFIGLGITGLFVLVGLGVLTWGSLTLKGSLALKNRGKITQGVIFDRWSYADADRDTVYAVAYYFDLPWHSPSDSRIIGAEDSRKAYNKFTVGDTVRIRYLPEEPKTCRLEMA